MRHNPRIRGRSTLVGAWGSYHLLHHIRYDCNFSFVINLWDHVFGTAHPGWLEQSSMKAKGHRC